MTETQVNIPLLRKAVEWVEQQAEVPEPNRQWWQPGVRTEASDIGRDCGTCYCIGGYIDTLAGGVGNNITNAIQALGLNVPSDLRGLFSIENTSADIRRIAEEIAGERL